MSLPTEDFAPETPLSYKDGGGDLVHWMAPGETRFGPTGMAAAFAVGLAVGLGALAAFQWIAPRREGLPPWRWRRGSVH